MKMLSMIILEGKEGATLPMASFIGRVSSNP
jgi:hypothetical protein